MSFRKLIPPFTLTGHIRPPPIGRLFIYRDVWELSFIVLGKILWLNGLSEWEDWEVWIGN